MRTVRLAVNGANGKMGQEIICLAKGVHGFYVCATMDERISEKNFDTHTRISSLQPKKLDVIIDFSSPKGALEISAWCAKNKKPLVLGTTGLGPKEKKKIISLSKKFPLLMSSNMSPGVNALAKALKEFSRVSILRDISIEEIHHKHKKDMPSGTALMLKEVIEGANIKNKVKSIQSLRGGEVTGIHKVYFFGANEYICFQHHALNRKMFAEGALWAARWILGKKPGLYSMEDVFAVGEKNES